MVVAGCGSDGGNSIHDGEVPVEASAFICSSTVVGYVLSRNCGAVCHAGWCYWSVDLSPEYVDAGRVNTLQNVIVKMVKVVPALKVVLPPLANRVRHIGVEALA